MEPLKRNLREALKQEHGDLTDDVIDLSEKLLAQRSLIDPSKEPEKIEEIDRQRAELLRTRMPRYKEVVERVRQQEDGGGL
jgi:hypothetical protein